MTESTTFSLANPPEMPDLNPNPETIQIPPLDPLFLSASDPISDLSFFLDDENGDFADFDFPFDDSADFFDFNLDAEVPVAISEESAEANREPSEKNERSDSVHSQVSSQGSGGCDALSSPEKSSSVSKRKKGDSGGEYRSFKLQKSDASPVEEDDEKKKVRLIRNRESAQLSRLRKKQYVEELQGKVKSMNSTIADLNGKISYVMAENAALRQQMMAASAAGGGAPPPRMNPYMVGPPLPYQWMPYPPYPYGSQIPIPKLPLPSCSRPKKGEGKSKLKKVAGISFIGIMFFMFLFGMLVPSMNNGGGDSGLSKYEGRRYYDEHRGKVLMVGDGSDVRRESGTYEGSVHSSRGHGERDSCGGVEGRVSNSSDPLFASLYVPRNDGLVKIDGNLIIHSVLASEKAKKNISETIKSKEEPDLTVPGALSSALAVPGIRGNGAMLPHTSKALSSGSPDGKRLHQWFHEGGAGTLMDYSMCTEVFQFDISPGAIVPSSVSNVTREHLQNVTTSNKRMKNRRILERLPVSRLASELNITEAQANKDAQNQSFHGKANTKPTSSSSMVVSVLLDPREVVDSETDRVMPSNTKSLSRIFVVVLLDSVKYVTYSCVLPRSGLHLVAT